MGQRAPWSLPSRGPRLSLLAFSFLFTAGLTLPLAPESSRFLHKDAGHLPALSLILYVMTQAA